MSDITREQILLIKRQTNYNEDEIREKLQLHNNNIEEIILEYINSDKRYTTFLQTNEETTTNQNIFKAIRENFDSCYEKGKITTSKNKS